MGRQQTLHGHLAANHGLRVCRLFDVHGSLRWACEGGERVNCLSVIALQLGLAFGESILSTTRVN
jgi:hypothetical protein